MGKSAPWSAGGAGGRVRPRGAGLKTLQRRGRKVFAGGPPSATRNNRSGTEGLRPWATVPAAGHDGVRPGRFCREAD